MPATKVVVNIPGEQPYDVRIGTGILNTLGSYMRKVPAVANASSVLILTDSNVAPLYLDRVKASLKQAQYRTFDITIPAGEENKHLKVMTEVWEAMGQLGMTRDAAVVALGGGVVGDMAGFAAASYMRGINVVQVPTTLLSMVDSSVGGKTGVNLSAGKNLVGAFKQPVYVCADVDTLSTLPEREWTCGLAEIAKASVIDSDEFFFWMLEHADDLAARESVVATEAITRSVIFKANVVAEDKTESKGVRECLNYGHTYGHAVEKLSGYGTYSHGAAVAEGMRFAARLAVSELGTSPELVQTQDELLDTLGLTKLDWSAPADEIISCMQKDKKARAGQMKFVLPADIGHWELRVISEDKVRTLL